MSEVELLDSFNYAFEQAWSNFQWWASVSFGLVALVTFGRKYLNLAKTVAVSLLYALFSAFTWLNTQATIVIASGHLAQLFAMRNAGGLAPAGENLVEWASTWGRVNGIISVLCFVGTFLGLQVYLWFSYRKKIAVTHSDNQVSTV